MYISGYETNRIPFKNLEDAIAYLELEEIEADTLALPPKVDMSSWMKNSLKMKISETVFN